MLQDWTVPPLACDAALPTNQMKYLHVDLGKEAAPLGPNNASDISIAARDLGTDNSGCGDPVITKESIMRRLFNRYVRRYPSGGGYASTAPTPKAVRSAVIRARNCSITRCASKP